MARKVQTGRKLNRRNQSCQYLECKIQKTRCFSNWRRHSNSCWRHRFRSLESLVGRDCCKNISLISERLFPFFIQSMLMFPFVALWCRSNEAQSSLLHSPGRPTEGFWTCLWLLDIPWRTVKQNNEIIQQQ